MKKLSYQGSVKNIYEHNSKLEFEFSDRYSIFDWGEMPNHIPKKGMHLNLINELLTLHLEAKKTYNDLELPHFLSKSEKDVLLSSTQFFNLKRYGALTHFQKKSSDKSFIGKKLDIYPPEYQNGKYLYKEHTLLNSLIPLEVVFRFGAPSGSSYLKRHLDVKADTFFDSIIIEFYTKLETQDRLLSLNEARRITQLSHSQLQAIINLTKLYACALYQKFQSLDYTLWDGKFEFALDNKARLILIDSIGPDELRLTRKGISYSKQVLRDFYKNSQWLKELRQKQESFPHDFKEKMQTMPKSLSSEQLEIASYIYESIARSLKDNQGYFNRKLDQKLKSLYQNIVIFGKGAREHALAKYLAKQKDVNKIYVIPGNAGMMEQKINTIDIEQDDYIHFCQFNHIHWAIIGPEDLLEQGLSDRLEQAHIPCFAPSKRASELETSKAFAKKLLEENSIPTAKYKSFTDIDTATSYISAQKFERIVVKQSSLAAGKGVIICKNQDEAIKAADELLTRDKEIIIEEFLQGREVSLFVLCHGEQYNILADACDYKRLLDNNEGPNTGGMGCYSPAYWLSHDLLEKIKSQIIQPILKAMMDNDRPFKGMLFIGLMIDNEGAKVLEFNTRFGDPETQTILPRVKSGLFECLRAIAFDDADKLNKSKIVLKDEFSLHIVKAAKGYPGVYEKIISGDQINIQENTAQNLDIYFAGVKRNKHHLLTNGGRVFGLTALGENLTIARKLAYENISKISFQGEQFRGDIGL